MTYANILLKEEEKELKGVLKGLPKTVLAK
jgi:hypothetical protein